LQAGAPDGAGVNSTNGVFAWQTSTADTNTTNHITVIVNDSGSPNLTANRTFTATVLSGPTILSVEISKSIVTLTWSAIAGHGYRLQTNADLNSPTWGDLGSNVIAPGSIVTASNLLDGATRFYRVRVLP
jgi:hypothetical protein